MMKQFSRKAQRKLERQEKKKRNNSYHQKKSKIPIESTKISKNDNILKTELSTVKKTAKKNKTQNKPKKSRFEREREQRLIYEEEREIKRYEKLLKLKSYTKKNKLPKSFYLDGLGDLIELCDKKKYNNRIVFNEDDSDDDNKKNAKDKQYEDEDDNDFESDYEEQNGDENEDEEEIGEDEENEFDDKLANSDQMDDQSDEEDSVSNSKSGGQQTKRNKLILNKDGFYEDIYGFVRDQDGNIVEQEKKENKLEKLNEQVVVDENLQRKLRGLLNRLTDSNMKVISGQIVDLYRINSRYVVNKGIFNCINNVLINVEHNVPCKLVAEISILISVLYTEIGEEVGGFFLHSIITQFDSAFNDSANWTGSKKLNNIVVLILNLYAAGLVDSQIVYDILEKFCSQFTTEKSIEMVDLVLRTCGFMLRKDDASKMKSLIMTIQKLSSSIDLSSSGNRVKFILESLVAIKNNNVAKLKSTETVLMSELIEHTLKAVIGKNRVACIPGQYSTVIQSSHWFSYTKNIVPLDTINGKDKTNETDGDIDDTDQVFNAETNIDYNLRDKLCQILRINTPLRRNLFTVLFQCNDYLDAAGKLISVGKKQFSEVINVVLHVAINEKSYNSFYYHLLQHLTTCDRKYKLALDFAVRDKIGQIETLKKKSRTILEQLIFQLLKGNALSITCLKVVQFSDMNEAYVDFIRNILQPIFAQDDNTIESILSKIPKKDNFASAIKLFITCFMDPDSKKRMSSVKQLQFKMKI